MSDFAKPRVLFCCNAYPPRFIGGAELIVEKHARALREMGIEAAVFAGDGQGAWGDHYEVRREDWNDVPVWRIQLACEDFAHLSVNFISRPVELQFEAMLDRFRPTIVHCHNLIGLSVQLLHLAKRRGLKTALTLHDHWMYCPRNTLVTPEGNQCDPRRSCSCQPVMLETGQRELPRHLRSGMMEKTASDVDFFHFPSSYLRDMYVRWGLPPEKCWAIPNGMETERFSQVQRSPSHSVRLTFVGYLGEHKGIFLLLEALARTPENSSLFLNIVGDGHLRETLATRIEDAGLAERVRLWGKVPNERIHEVYEQTDCLVLPSLWPENHPVSINEALACGIPVIGSNSGGIPELVIPYKTGYLFEQGNPEELQRILSHLARNPECLQVLSANAREDSKRLSLTRTMRRMLKLYGIERQSPGGWLAARGADNAHGPETASSMVHDSNGAINVSDRPERRRRPLTVACFAERFDETGAGIVRAMDASPRLRRVRLVSADWLYDSQFDDVDVLWFAQRDLPIPRIDAAREDAIILLPHDHVAVGYLANDPRTLLYHDAETALGILRRLTANTGRLSLHTMFDCEHS